LPVHHFGRHDYVFLITAGHNGSSAIVASQSDAKAELNRRGQACEVLAGTGVRAAKFEAK